MLVIGLAGRAGSGKSTVAHHLVMERDWIHYGFANPLKGGVMAMFGATPEQIEGRKEKELALPVVDRSPRFLLQELGGWARTNLGEDIWVRIARHIIREAMAAPELAYAPAMVISDVRYENEAALIRDELGGHIVHIMRPGNPFVVRSHSSEAGIQSKPGDLVLTNGGSLDDLVVEVELLLERLSGEIADKQAARAAAFAERSGAEVVELDAASLPADWDKECHP